MRNFGITNCAPWASAPPVGAAGDTYWNTTNKTLYVSDGTAWVPWPSGGGASFPPDGDVYQVLVNAGSGQAWGWAEANIRRVDQNAHGFTVGQVLKLTPSGYALAQADTVANAEVCGAVYSIINANAFVIALHGRIGSGFSGLTLGQVLYLSPTTPGAVTSVAPTTPGQINKPVFIAEGSGSVYFINMRGSVIPALPTGALGNLAEAYDEGIDISTTANADIPTLQATFTAVSGRSYMISWGALIQSAANDRVMLRVMNVTLASAQMCSAQRFAQATPQSIERTQLLRCPSNQIPAGVNTLRCNVWRLAGTGTTRVTSGSVDPGFLVVADAGKTPT